MRGPEQGAVGSSQRAGGEVQHVNPSACPGPCAASGPLGRSPPPKDHLEHYLTSAEWRCLEDRDLRAISGNNIFRFACPRLGSVCRNALRYAAVKFTFCTAAGFSLPDFRGRTGRDGAHLVRRGIPGEEYLKSRYPSGEC